MAPINPDFELVVAETYNDVYRFARTLTKSSADAADITQQAFLKFARKGDQIRDRTKIKSWLFSTLRNEFVDNQRHKTKFPLVQLEASEDYTDTTAARQADSKIALAALGSIDPVYREPLALYYLEGYTYPEIAKLLDIPIGTVMSRLSRGRSKLREHFNTTPTRVVSDDG